MKTVLSTVIWLALIASSSGQDLARRSFFGIDCTMRDKHFIVSSVALGSTAEAAGIHAGDELLTINGESLSSPAQITELARKFRAGSTIQFAVRRAQETLTKSSTALALPMERNDGVDTLYKTVNADGVLYRAIITKPRDNGKHPAVLLIGGLGCYSLDSMKANGASCIAGLDTRRFRDDAHR